MVPGLRAMIDQKPDMEAEGHYGYSAKGYSSLLAYRLCRVTLLFDHLRAVACERPIAEYSFCDINPSFDREELCLGFRIDGDEVGLLITHSGGLAPHGTARLTSYA